jgi:hypothetical protein
METAIAELSATPPEFDPARGSQDDAISQLTAAVAILSPPQQPDDGTSDPQEGGEGEAQPGQDQPSEQQRQQAGNMDPAQLLQSVRDREAERRRQQTSRDQRGYETVEKDW